MEIKGVILLEAKAGPSLGFDSAEINRNRSSLQTVCTCPYYACLLILFIMLSCGIIITKFPKKNPTKYQGQYISSLYDMQHSVHNITFCNQSKVFPVVTQMLSIIGIQL